MPLRLIGGALIKWVGGGTIAAALLAGAAWIWHERQSNRLTEAQGELALVTLSRDAWRLSAAHRGERLALVIAERDASREAVQQLQGRLADMDAAYRAQRRAITDAPAADDGPVAPVLRNALEGLP
ncbi:MAG: hypothetical protein WD057_18870 [Aquisalimonadaceae bacterium]